MKILHVCHGVRIHINVSLLFTAKLLKTIQCAESNNNMAGFFLNWVVANVTWYRQKCCFILTLLTVDFTIYNITLL